MTVERKNEASTKNQSLTIKPEELKKKIDKGEEIFILDVRNQKEHDLWSVSYDKYKDSPIIPIDQISNKESLQLIPKDKEIVTFCTHGQRSSSAAKTLSSLGYRVRTIEGGLDGWSTLYDIAPINTGSKDIKIWQIRRISKGCMSYIIASVQSKNALLLDATCNIDKVVNDLLEEHGLKISNIIDTHMHADHLSGSTRLGNLYEGEIDLSTFETYNYENIASGKYSKSRQIKDGEKLRVSDSVALEAIHTPGHTDGSLSFKLEIQKEAKKATDQVEGIKDDITNDQPKIFLFTGDTIFVNGVGRPDLHNKSEEYAKKLFQTYQDKIFNLPDETIILPAHYNASFDHEKPIYNTIGSIKQKLTSITNSESEFVKFVTSNIPPQPMNYEKIVLFNKNLTSCETVDQKDLESGPNSCGISA
ncbi:MBL fold metallo-hydrolase [Candidatus Nitrosocosmicus hydrocola]|uniref:MBL fold metallo-hydrolase n=1 Tax=Candidatus Nitrosocosmicus hydrocola TaxID=1826872 RepID=UPI001372B230|nr:rhodanese-like domain-containing protein [Candidatus Nitrosocosmicus hydrocola]